MTRSQLEEHMGEKVKIRLFDDSVYDGYLHKTGEVKFKNDPNLYIPRKLYFLTDENNVCRSCLFRISHIKGFQMLDLLY